MADTITSAKSPMIQQDDKDRIRKASLANIIRKVKDATGKTPTLLPC